jgi:hypothetical protein
MFFLKDFSKRDARYPNVMEGRSPHSCLCFLSNKDKTLSHAEQQTEHKTLLACTAVLKYSKERMGAKYDELI